MFLKRFTLVLALLLTIFAFEAKALNPFAETCLPGSTIAEFRLDNVCGCSIMVEICWHCPDDAIDTLLKIKVQKVTFLDDLQPDSSCNWMAEITNRLYKWSFITSYLCPNWPIVPPCIPIPPNSPYPVNYYFRGVVISWPFCGHYEKDINGNILCEPCLPITCSCVSTYKYCYDEQLGVLREYLDWQGIIPYPGVDPTNCPNYSCPCHLDMSSVPFPTIPGLPSACFHLCDCSMP